MVAEPCVAPYKGCSHIGSRDRCEELDYAARTFRPTNLGNSSCTGCEGVCEECEENGEELLMMQADDLILPTGDFSREETEYLRSIMQSSTMAWLADRRIDPVARSTNAMTLS